MKAAGLRRAVAALLRHAGGAALACGLAGGAWAQALWLGDGTGLWRVDVPSARIVAQQPLAGTTQVAGTASGGAWALAAGDLVRVAPAGEVAARASVVALGYGDARLLAVDADDAGAWVVTAAGLLARFDAQARIAGGYTLPRQALAVAAGNDGTVWAAFDYELTQFSASSAPLATLPVPPEWREPIRALVVDGPADRLWIVGDAAIAALAADGSLVASSALPDGGGIRAAVLDPATGNLWLLTASALAVRDEHAQPIATLPLAALGVDDARALAWDGPSGAPILAAPARVVALDRSGAPAAAIDLPRPFDLVAATPLDVAPRAAIAPKANQAPTVTLTAPANNATYPAGATITLAASAADADGSVVRVDFYRDGTTLLGTATAAPFSVAWANVPAGTYKLTAKATDNRKATKTSIAVSVTVAANAPPLVVLTSPAPCAAAAAPASFTLAADALDRDGTIARVEFYRDDVLLGTAGAPPYVLAWPDVAPGIYALTAVAIDDRGARTAATPVTVTVRAPGEPPSVALTAPANGAVLVAPATIDLAATAADADGSVVRVEFFAGSTLIGTATAPPYATTWRDVPGGSYVLTARATDNAGAQTTSAPVSVLVDRPPVVTLTGPVDGSAYPLGAYVVITGTATDGDDALAKMELLRNGVSQGQCLPAPTGSSYSCTWTWLAAPGGYFTFAWKATDAHGAAAVSAPVHVTINALPQVTLTAPAWGASYASSASIEIVASATEVIGTIARVDFFANGLPIGTATSAPFTITWANVASGSYTLTATATDNLGTTGTSSPVTIAVDPFALNVTSPRTGEAIYGAAAYVSGSFAGAVPDAITVNGRSAVIGSGTFGAFVPLAAGDNVITVVATVGGASVTRSVTVYSAVPSITASMLAGGPTFHDDNVMVRGYVAAAANSAVYVNGRPAVLEPNGNFFANNVPLAAGANAITVTLNTEDWSSVQRTYTVYSDAVAPFGLEVTPDRAVAAPLPLTVTLTNRTLTPYATLEIDFEGNGTYDLVEKGPETPVAQRVFGLTYTKPGTYELRLRLRDANQQILYAAARRIRIGEPADQAKLLRGVYTGMLDRLRAGSIDAAMGAITETVRERYRNAFVRLGAALPRAIDGLGEVVNGTMSEDFGALTVTRERPDGVHAFEVQLIRDGDGLWRIDGM